MKKFLVASMMFLVFAVGLPLTVEGHNDCRRHRRKSYTSRTYRNYNARYATRGYYAEQRRPSFYRRHRNVIHMAIGTGAGALLGGLIGGGRGAGIGALAGLGGSALYTYKLNPKKRRYYRRY
jgi:outer membrane lipoprotein SlyB